MTAGRLHTNSGAVARHLVSLAPLTRTTSQAAADEIRDAIVGGRLRPGERIREQDLAEALGISRTPVREALFLLQNEGLVDSRPRRTAVVRAFGADEIDDMYQVRALLEGYAARRAATRISASELAELEASCARFRALVDAHESILMLMKENLAFHDRIVAAAQSPRLSLAARTVAPVPLAYTSLYWHAQHDRIASAQSHERIVQSLAGRDAERAELMMKEHVFEVRDALVASLRALEIAKTNLREGA